LKQKNNSGLKGIKDILVVRQHNQIGDILCSLTMYAALKKKYPDSQITLVASKTNYEIPFFEINPYIDHVLVYDKTNIKTIFNFFRKLRRRKYQIGIVPSTIKVSRTSHIINFFSGAKVRAGVKAINGTENKSHRLLNVKSSFLWKGLHQTERNLDVVRQIGCDLNEEEKATIKFEFTNEEKAEAKKNIDDNFPGRTKKVIGFHPGAGKTVNIWDTRKFTELIKKLFAEYNNNILITSGWTDEPIVKDVIDDLTNSDIQYKVAHNLQVRKLGALLSQLDLYITNDTGSMHIAGFSGTKMISLFGPTDPAEWVPVNNKSYFIKSESTNINDISVNEVYELSRNILEETI